MGKKIKLLDLIWIAEDYVIKTIWFKFQMTKILTDVKAVSNQNIKHSWNNWVLEGYKQNFCDNAFTIFNTRFTSLKDGHYYDTNINEWK